LSVTLCGTGIFAASAASSLYLNLRRRPVGEWLTTPYWRTPLASKKPHPADLVEIKKIATATHFTIHLCTGQHDKTTERAKTLEEAIEIADAIGATPSGRPPMIYAITSAGTAALVPATMIAQARRNAAKTPRKTRGRPSSRARRGGASRAPE
jgi:hypothetical protein